MLILHTLRRLLASLNRGRRFLIVLLIVLRLSKAGSLIYLNLRYLANRIEQELYLTSSAHSCWQYNFYKHELPVSIIPSSVNVQIIKQHRIVPTQLTSNKKLNQISDAEILASPPSNYPIPYEPTE